jgi:5-methyltetrahydrofolate--homocysteine methyltransferase
MTDFQPLIDALIARDAERVNGLVAEALEQGAAPEAVLNDGLIAAMDVVGRLMAEEELFIPEVLMAAQVMNQAVETLRPRLAEGSVKTLGRVVIGTVKGDLHDIGKNLVAMMLGSAGFQVRDLGVDVSPQTFVEVVKDGGVDIVCLSALLTTTMSAMRRTVASLTEAGLRGRVKVLIGGAPVTRKFAEEIGADGYAPDAGGAIGLARKALA